ncbi:hypothetical protein [Pseudolabrys taiwanensis]|uniref:hypothetical protein n=1 Tax=Pseudolabrys taiwanensis TaxID=331696 RepID=UPI0013B37D91|nr:hypothetical protein [Pseudolabrys taiwanensis]
MSTIVTPGVMARPLLVAGLVGGLLLAATAGLWVFYGTAVFFEVIRTGWVACF